MPFMMNDFYAAENAQQANQIQKQRIAENERVASEAKRVLEENAKARDIQTQAYNAPQQYKTLEIPDATPAAAPQGMVPTQQLIPQAGLTGLGGMSTPQQAPVGMQPTENLGGMQQPAAPAQPIAPTGIQQPTEAAPSTPIAKAQASAKTVQVAESEVQKVQRVADELHKAGLHDQADAYLEKQTGLTKKVEDAKKVHLENTTAMAERAANLGNSYIEAVKNGSEPNAAWAELLIKASADGYPIESLLTVVDPKQRMAKAEEIVNNAETTKQRAQMEREVYKQTEAARRTQFMGDLRVKLAQEATARSAASQAAIKDRWEKSNGLALYKTQESNIKNTIGTAQRDRDDYDQQIRDIDLKIRDIDTLAIPMKEAEKTAKLATLNEARNELQSARNTADKQVKELEGHLNTLHESFVKSGIKEEPSPSATSPAKPTTPAVQSVTPDKYPDVYAGAKNAIEVQGKPAEAIKAEFKRLTGQDYDTFKSSGTSIKTIELPAIRYITTQADLDSAIKAKLLKPNEIKAAKDKLKSLSLQNKETRASQAEQDRIKKIQETTLKSGPLAPFTL